MAKLLYANRVAPSEIKAMTFREMKHYWNWTIEINSGST